VLVVLRQLNQDLGLTVVLFIPLAVPFRRNLLGVIIIAGLYNAVLWALVRSERMPFLHRGYVGTIGDMVLTVLTVAATGGFASPFLIAFFPLVVVIGLRFGAVGSLLSCVLISLLLLSALGMGMPGAHWADILVKLGFIAVTALLTGVLADRLGRARRTLLAELRWAQALHNATQRPNVSLALPEVLTSVGEEVHRLAEATYSLVWYRPGDAAGVLPYVVTTPATPANPLHQLWQEEGPALLGSSRATRPAIISLQKSPSFQILHVPLVVKGATVGSIVLARDQRAHFDEVTVEALQAFAQRAALAMQNAYLYEQLQQRVEEIRRTQAQLVQSAKLAALGELAAQVAHEVNNPLGGVLLQLGLLLEDKVPARVRRGLAIIEQEVLRVREIVRNLLEFARQSEPGFGPVEVNKLVAATVALCRHRATLQKVEIAEQYMGTLEVIQADGNQLKQVFLNIMTNALDVMPNGGTLIISTRQEDDHVVISFADTGPGMSQEVRDRIFEPFFTTKSAVKGTGLGLAVSHGIISNHGGHIQVETQVGKGSIFSVWLPVRQSHQEMPHAS